MLAKGLTNGYSKGLEKLMTYEELKQALAVFDIQERATLHEIARRHRNLVKLHHPDRGGVNDLEPIRRINEAYALIRSYIEGYSFSFTEEEFYSQNPEELMRRRFMDDPLWGGSARCR
jgi:hypothetical protein